MAMEIDFRFKQKTAGVKKDQPVDFNTEYESIVPQINIIQPKSILPPYDGNIFSNHVFKAYVFTARLVEVNLNFKKNKEEYFSLPQDQINFRFGTDTSPENIVIYTGGIPPLDLFSNHKVFNYNSFIKANGLIGTNFGIASLTLYRKYIQTLGFNSLQVGSLGIYNKNKFVKLNGLNTQLFGQSTIQNLKRFLIPIGLNAGLFGSQKIQSLRAYVNLAGTNFIQFGGARISYKEQQVTVRQASSHTLFGNQRIAYSLRYLEQLSNTALSRFGTAWLSFSPRYIEPRGIFTQFPSNHQVGISRTVFMEGFDFLRFGTRIVPESQVILPIGMSTIFGHAKIENRVQHVKPKGFLTVGERADLRFGHITTFNLTQYVKPFHDDTSKAAGPLFPDIRQHEIFNRNRYVQTHGRINTLFGYADIFNKARVVRPVGLASPLEVEPTKTFIADRIRRIYPDAIESPYISAWHTAWLGAKVAQQKGAVLSLFGMPHVENTRRNFRFIGMGEQTLFGRGMISHAIRNVRIQEEYSIAPPVIPMPEVKLGTRYIEPRSIDSVRYGWAHLAEKFTKIAPRWVVMNRVGEPIIHNLTPQVKMWQFESLEWGVPSIGLYTRDLKVSGLNAQIFGRARLSDRKQQIEFRGYGLAPPEMNKLHKIENVGAGTVQARTIRPNGLSTKNFEDDPKKLHKVHQNVLKPYDQGPMTLYGAPVVTANTIRVEPGYWEILMGKPTVTNRNRTIFVDSSACDFLGIGKPRMSPHTIWAVMDAPDQARENHQRPLLPLHYVDSLDENNNIRPPGIILGTPRISHKNRRINAGNLHSFAAGAVSLRNTVFIIQPKGWNNLRIGVIGPIGKQTINFRAKPAHTLWGTAAIANVKIQNNDISTTGLSLNVFGKPVVDYFHRFIKPAGINSLAMGTRKNEDKPYMWQGLRVGAHVPTNIGGLNATIFGTAWISYRVREISLKGNDYMIVADYQLGNFDKRMEIRNVNQPEQPVMQLLKPTGFNAQLFGVPDVKPKTHYIRPDGNMDNYRKGGL